MAEKMLQRRGELPGHYRQVGSDQRWIGSGSIPIESLTASRSRCLHPK